MELAEYFSPIQRGKDEQVPDSIGQIAQKHTEEAGFPDWDEADIALIGVPEERGTETNKGCALGPDQIREYFYKLFPGNYTLNMVDLGNIIPGETLNDTYHGLSHAITELVKRDTIPVILGGSQDLTYANYQAYEQLEQVVNLVAIDQSLDLGEPEDSISERTYLSKIILKQPNYLFNFSNIGYQTYLVKQQELTLMDQLFFERIRLGEVRANMHEAEPMIRDADIVSVDMAAVKQADAPGNRNAGPNGLYGEEICQLGRYAGFSDKLSSFGIYGVNPTADRDGQTAHLAAQLVWCFIDGFYSRKKDFPVSSKKDYVKYRVAIKDHQNELIFYKSLKSDRWWMDVPYPAGRNKKYQRHQVVPCSYSDYQMACEEEVPDKWWRTYQKLSG